jgi:hypothetical protein
MLIQHGLEFLLPLWRGHCFCLDTARDVRPVLLLKLLFADKHWKITTAVEIT